MAEPLRDNLHALAALEQDRGVVMAQPVKVPVLDPELARGVLKAGAECARVLRSCRRARAPGTVHPGTA
jgi:hypothetical protein